jgi:hypothetical protein
MRVNLSREVAAGFADVALAHVTREYPGKMDHILTGPADIASPRALHPTFYGSFDWHSCVHGFWLLAKILRLFPDLSQASQIRALFDEQLTPAKIAAEMSYLEKPFQKNFERPYGWAWLLMLASELSLHTKGGAHAWYDHLQPLTELLAGRMKVYLSKLPFPIRAGIALILIYPPTANETGEIAKLAARYFGGLSEAIADLIGRESLRLDGRLAGLLSFVYTYHYLNWFIKVRVISWHKIPKLRPAAIAGLSIGATGLYLYDYGLGLKVLFSLSLLHVVLEFPLNAIALRQLIMRTGGARSGKPLANAISLRPAE